MKAEETQDTQIVFRHALSRIADETHDAGGQIGAAIGIVVEPPFCIGIQGIDGEVPPRGILGPVSAEPHGGVAAIGVSLDF